MQTIPAEKVKIDMAGIIRFLFSKDMLEILFAGGDHVNRRLTPTSINNDSAVFPSSTPPEVLKRAVGD